jgi:hypothetical protein
MTDQPLDVRYALNGAVTSTDTALLDTIEAELPDLTHDLLGDDLTVSRTDNDDGSETLTATLRFAPDGTEATVEHPDGTTVTHTPETYARAVFEQIKTHELAHRTTEWHLRFYRAPQGGVLASDVRAYYEANPDLAPTDDEGNTVLPNRWRADRHTIATASNNSQ